MKPSFYHSFGFALFLLPLGANAQQLPDRSPFTDISFVWNPAMTAVWDYWELAANYRQQWVGFEDAPLTASLAVQYPFPKFNTSIGGFFFHDETRPLQSNVVGFNYAYKMKAQRRGSGQLSFGLTTTLQQFTVDGLDIVVNDDDDLTLPRGEITTIVPNAGVGVFYTSRGGSDFDKSFFFAGLAANQLFPFDLRFKASGTTANFKRAIHANATLGYRAIKENMFIEPSVWINYSAENILDANLSIKMERQDAFWAGLTYNTNQTLSVQLGYILINGLPRDAALRIGAMGSYNIGTFGQARGVGYEFYAAWRFVQ
ncbi:MAG: PorP/SprF family type IX secretion system membrane protein [Saprospiraceae bacterium]|nr:PorP/SprF family type IX secretion system membrane protein [Saprospiraceae bacterium]MDZ4705279.1 PorP/SprF family type IX secretion system membrane protein [Saprospiraceae bacterium]